MSRQNSVCKITFFNPAYDATEFDSGMPFRNFEYEGSKKTLVKKLSSDLMCEADAQFICESLFGDIEIRNAICSGNIDMDTLLTLFEEEQLNFSYIKQMESSGTLHILSKPLVLEALQKGYITACLLAVHKAVAATVEARIDAIISTMSSQSLRLGMSD
jgi:hypothetical protein